MLQVDACVHASALHTSSTPCWLQCAPGEVPPELARPISGMSAALEAAINAHTSLLEVGECCMYVACRMQACVRAHAQAHAHACMHACTDERTHLLQHAKPGTSPCMHTHMPGLHSACMQCRAQEGAVPIALGDIGGSEQLFHHQRQQQEQQQQQGGHKKQQQQQHLGPGASQQLGLKRRHSSPGHEEGGAQQAPCQPPLHSQHNQQQQQQQQQQHMRPHWRSATRNSSAFEGHSRPPITLPDYVARILRYTKISPVCLLVATAHVGTLCKVRNHPRGAPRFIGQKRCLGVRMCGRGPSLSDPRAGACIVHRDLNTSVGAQSASRTPLWAP